ncbi:hypothetical protein GGU11DRAFT_760779, partial [Lentinula aff. detonsa]
HSNSVTVREYTLLSDSLFAAIVDLQHELVQEDFDQGWRKEVNDKYKEWTTVRRDKGKGRLAGGKPEKGEEQEAKHNDDQEHASAHQHHLITEGAVEDPDDQQPKNEDRARSINTARPRPMQMYTTMQIGPYQTGLPQPMPQYMPPPAMMLTPHMMQYLQPPPPSQSRYPVMAPTTSTMPGRWSEEPIGHENEKQMQHYGNEAWK